MTVVMLPCDVLSMVHDYVCSDATSVRDVLHWFATCRARQWCTTDRDLLHRCLVAIRRNNAMVFTPEGRFDILANQKCLLQRRNVLTLALAVRTYDDLRNGSTVTNRFIEHIQWMPCYWH